MWPEYFYFLFTSQVSAFKLFFDKKGQKQTIFFYVSLSDPICMKSTFDERYSAKLHFEEGFIGIAYTDRLPENNVCFWVSTPAVSMNLAYIITDKS